MGTVIERKLLVERWKGADGKVQYKVLPAFLTIDDEIGTTIEPASVEAVFSRIGSGGIANISDKAPHNRITDLLVFEGRDGFRNTFPMFDLSGLQLRDFSALV